MSLFNIITANGSALDYCPSGSEELNTLILTNDIRDRQGGKDGEEEYRTTIRVSTHYFVKEITSLYLAQNNLIEVPSIDVNIGGSDPVTIGQGLSMLEFEAMSQTISPELEKGTSYNRVDTEWVSTTAEGEEPSGQNINGWTALDRLTTTSGPSITIVSNAGSQTYTSCDETDVTGVWCESREIQRTDQYGSGTIEQIRLRCTTVQFFDVIDVSAISGLNSECAVLTTLPSAGLNSGSTSEININPTEFGGVSNWVMTEFSLTPLMNVGSKIARAKFKWDLYTPWQDR